MIFKQKDITITDVLENAFTFTKIDIPDEFIKHIENLEYEYEDQGTDVKYSVTELSKQTDDMLRIILEQLDIDETMKRDIKSYSFGVDKYTKGDGLPLHTDKGRLNPYEILIYMPEDDEFIGRDLQVVNDFYNVKVRPIRGLVCFINAYAEDTFHGVTPLETDSTVYVLLGGIGINSRDWRDGINIKEDKKCKK
jgi:hypothetical protein